MITLTTDISKAETQIVDLQSHLKGLKNIKKLTTATFAKVEELKQATIGTPYYGEVRKAIAEIFHLDQPIQRQEPQPQDQPIQQWDNSIEEAIEEISDPEFPEDEARANNGSISYEQRIEAFHKYIQHGLTPEELSSRLRVREDVLLERREKSVSDFALWTGTIDPEGLEWGKRSARSKVFYPCNPQREKSTAAGDNVQNQQQLNQPETTQEEEFIEGDVVVSQTNTPYLLLSIKGKTAIVRNFRFTAKAQNYKGCCDYHLPISSLRKATHQADIDRVRKGQRAEDKKEGRPGIGSPVTLTDGREGKYLSGRDRKTGLWKVQLDSGEIIDIDFPDIAG